MLVADNSNPYARQDTMHKLLLKDWNECTKQ